MTILLSHPVADTLTLLSALIRRLDCPACIVIDGEEIVAQNHHWCQITAKSTDVTTCLCAPAHLRRAPLEECLRNVSPVEILLTALRSRTQSSGLIAVQSTMSLWGAASNGTSGRQVHTYQLSWHQIELASSGKTLAFVLLKNEYPSGHADAHSIMQQLRINRLLIRQTLIEEAERRRLSQVLHDGLIQDLAQMFSDLSSDSYSNVNTTKITTMLKNMIEQARSMVFELSPPILHDLGLLPALSWLAEYLNDKYDAKIVVRADSCEPVLPNSALTILFRAVRELAVNASKHAPGADIELSCSVENNMISVMVRDNGPGFDVGSSSDGPDDEHNFGLLSVEQQIRGIGGEFNLVSSSTDGTRATITLPIPDRKNTDD